MRFVVLQRLLRWCMTRALCVVAIVAVGFSYGWDLSRKRGVSFILGIRNKRIAPAKEASTVSITHIGGVP